MTDKNNTPETAELSRRQFLKVAGGLVVGAAIGGAVPRIINLGEGLVAIPASEGYLLVDTEKCAGCSSCMAVCSLAHEGKVSLSLSCIQVLRNPLGAFPNDIKQQQCRQCAFPACVEACPTGALHADEATGGVRLLAQDKCIGCMQCIEACPHQTSRIGWNQEKTQPLKCDLCKEAKYWDGPEPACVTVCPMKAIKYTTEIPVQIGDEGYKVNLKTDKWGQKYWTPLLG